MKLDKLVRMIAEQMACCKQECEGVNWDKNLGYIPRVPLADIKGCGNGPGMVIVGMHPARTSYNERKLNFRKVFSENNFQEKRGAQLLAQVRYFGQIRELIRPLVERLGFDGPILWTEMVKCETKAGQDMPMQTRRICSALYFLEEMKAIPKEWPLVAVGQKVFDALCYLFPERPIVGIPHPRASSRYFNSLKKEAQTGNIRIPVESWENDEYPIAVWLKAE